MDEARPQPPSAGAPVGAGGDVAGRRQALRRFHLGDPDAPGVPLPAGLVPVALEPVRGVAVRGGWPLLVDPENEPFARPFGEWLAEAASDDSPLAGQRARLEQRVADRVGSGARPAREALSEAAVELARELDDESSASVAASAAEIAARLGAGAQLVGFDRDAPLEIAHRAAGRRVTRARRRFAARAAELVTAADAILEADRGRRPSGLPTGEQVGRFGALGSRFVDAERLAGIVGHRRAGNPLAEERRQWLERARSLLADTVLDAAEPLWFLPRGLAPRALPGTVRFVEAPCVAAARGFDRVAAEIATLVRAARLLSLEAANALDLERHLPWLDRLDWHGFDADELALVPPVFALVRPSDLVGGGLAGLSRLLLTGRPVQVLVLADEEERSAETRFEPALLGIAHREAFVHQGSVAVPVALADGIVRAIDGGRVALHVIDAPADAPDGIDLWLVAAARVAGRGTPLVVYDPDAGGSWSRRLRIDGNPEPLADWPADPLLRSEPTPDGTPSFTFADAALLDPRWRGDFALAPEGENDLVPLADWLELAPEQAIRRLPTVRAIDGEGGEARLVVTRDLAFATRDRLDFWRHLEELAGIRAEAVEEAAARATAEADERAASARAELEQTQSAELERVRAAADAEAAGRIVQALIALGGGEPVAIGALAAPPAAAAPAGGAAAPAATQGAAPEAAAQAATPVEREDAWIDTALCTSCDECTRRSPGIFVYNADKQAYIKNPRGGTFREIVVAAAACTARVIHPGKPWNPSEPDLAKWVERAREYQ